MQYVTEPLKNQLTVKIQQGVGIWKVSTLGKFTLGYCEPVYDIL